MLQEEQATRRKWARTCSLCSLRTQNCKRHMKSHLPPFTIPDRHCWDCGRFLAQIGSVRRAQHNQQFGCGSTGVFTDAHLRLWVQLVTGTLLLICQFLKLPGIPSLFEFVKQFTDNQPEAGDSKIEDCNRKWFRKFEERNGYPIRVNRDYCFPINSLGMLTHWRVVFNLLKLLSPEQQKQVQQLREPTDHRVIPMDLPPDDFRLRLPYQAIDSHFHLEKLMGRLGETEWWDVQKHLPSDFEVVLKAAVTCFAFPETWPILRPSGSGIVDPAGFLHSSMPSIPYTIG